jgi:hypothetical protein
LQPFVGLDITGGIEAVAYVLSHHGCEFESDHLPPLRREVDWSQRRIRSARYGRREDHKKSQD